MDYFGKVRPLTPGNIGIDLAMEGSVWSCVLLDRPVHMVVVDSEGRTYFLECPENVPFQGAGASGAGASRSRLPVIDFVLLHFHDVCYLSQKHLVGRLSSD